MNIRDLQLTDKINEINKQQENCIQERFDYMLKLYVADSDYRYGVKSLHIAWSEALPLPGKGSESQLPEAQRVFQIACFPVTVWQYRQFINDGCEEDSHWTKYGNQWRFTDKLRTVPLDWPKQSSKHDNRPVTGVSWYEAMAFSTWLTIKHRIWGLLGEDQVLRLPTKDEWVLAATFDPVTRKNKSEDKEWVTEKRRIIQEYRKVTHKHLTPVGVFVGNISPCGAYDMSGSVREWCSSGTRDGETSEYPCDDLATQDEEADICGGSYLFTLSGLGWESLLSDRPDSRSE